MLWFNKSQRTCYPNVKKFQYILCYGSTGRKDCQCPQSKKFQYILCYGSTKITPTVNGIVINFNTSYVMVQHLRRCRFCGKNQKFQYILCYGSTIIYKQIPHLLNNFNTSYVMVQLLDFSGAGCRFYISIHLMLWFNLQKQFFALPS